MDERIRARVDEALALQDEGDVGGAAAIFAALGAEVDRDPRFAEEAGNLYLYRLDDPASAIPAYRRALEQSDDRDHRAELHHRIGIAHTKRGDDDAASLAFADAHRENPVHAGTFLEVARLHMRKGLADDALAYLDTAFAHHVMATALSGGPHPHFRLLVLMDKARTHLALRRDAEAGLAVARELLAAGDTGRLETLARELVRANEPELAARVEALLG